MKVLFDNIKTGNNLKKMISDNKNEINNLSSVIGISNKNLKNYINGKKQIRLKDLIIFCNYYNVTLESVLSYKIIYT